MDNSANQNKGTIEEAIMPFKIQQMAEIIMQKKCIGFTDALHYLYSTDIYQLLLSEETKLWYLSGLSLYEMIENEKRAQRKNILKNRKLTLFFSFCVENYKNHIHRPAEEVLSLFSTYGVFDFLEEGYEMLHTQGKEYIMEEIDEFLRIRKV
jgi:hypothetical protein